VRRSRFCASLLERRQCERAELDRSVVSLDHDRTRLGLVRIAGDRRQSLDLFAVDESFPVQHYRDVAPDQPDVVGLPLARTIGNIKGRSLAAVDGSGLVGPNSRSLRQRPLAPPPNRTPLIMAQQRRTSTAQRATSTTRDNTPESGLSSAPGIDGQRAVLTAKVGRLAATGRRSRGPRDNSASRSSGLDPIQWTGFVPWMTTLPRAHHCAHQL